MGRIVKGVALILLGVSGLVSQCKAQALAEDVRSILMSIGYSRPDCRAMWAVNRQMADLLRLHKIQRGHVESYAAALAIPESRTALMARIQPTHDRMRTLLLPYIIRLPADDFAKVTAYYAELRGLEDRLQTGEVPDAAAGELVAWLVWLQHSVVRACQPWVR